MQGSRLDKTVIKAQTVAEASDYSSYYKSISWQERLHIAAFLNSIAYNYPLNNTPKMDKTKFKATSRK